MNLPINDSNTPSWIKINPNNNNPKEERKIKLQKDKVISIEQLLLNLDLNKLEDKAYYEKVLNSDEMNLGTFDQKKLFSIYLNNAEIEDDNDFFLNYAIRKNFFESPMKFSDELDLEPITLLKNLIRKYFHKPEIIEKVISDIDTKKLDLLINDNEENIFHCIADSGLALLNNITNDELIRERIPEIEEISKKKEINYEEQSTLESKFELQKTKQRLEDLGKTKLEIFEDIKKSIQYILKKQSFLLLDQEDKNGYKPYEIALANNNFFLSQELKKPEKSNQEIDVTKVSINDVENIYLKSFLHKWLKSLIIKPKELYFYRKDGSIKQFVEKLSSIQVNKELEKKYIKNQKNLLELYINSLPIKLINKLLINKTNNQSSNKKSETNNTPKKLPLSRNIMKKNIKTLFKFYENEKNKFLELFNSLVKRELKDKEIHDDAQNLIYEINKILTTQTSAA
ncbi:MAG: hypothetical protein HRT47_00375 [Candidatus Caenarcaniphilales bacterium]|nr:hypothetical protein [Candidatus Caenarcaniphilales bacterium]